MSPKAVRTVAVIGGGPGGYAAAVRAAQLGASVTLIERERVGGTCLNRGCIPARSLQHAALLVRQLRERGAELGLRAAGVEPDFPQMMAHKDAVVEKLAADAEAALAECGILRLAGSAAFTAPQTLEVTGADGSRTVLTPDAVILAVGSVSAPPSIPGLGGNPDCLSSADALALEKLPESLAVIGGGVIGLELACIYAALGAKVTVAEAADRVLPMLDDEQTRIGLRQLRRMGVSLRLGTAVQSLKREADGVRIVCRDKNGTESDFTAEKVLTATGRRTDLEALHPERGGLTCREGRLAVNDRMETVVPGVYAVGDCAAGYARMAHAAMAMGEVAAERSMSLDSVYEESTNPTCVYLEPESAAVGLTQAQAAARGIACVAGRASMAANGRAVILNGGTGLAKVVVSAAEHRVLGVQITGPDASGLIAEGALAIRMNCTAEELASVRHAHPSPAEAVRAAAADAVRQLESGAN